MVVFFMTLLGETLGCSMEHSLEIPMAYILSYCTKYKF